MTERIPLRIIGYLFNISFTCKYIDNDILAEVIYKFWFPKSSSREKRSLHNLWFIICESLCFLLQSYSHLYYHWSSFCRLSVDLISSVTSFFEIFTGRKSCLCGHWHPCFGLLVPSALGLKARVDPFLCAFSPVWSSDSPVVRHLLTINWYDTVHSARQPSLFDPHRRVHKHWWRFGPGPEPMACLCSEHNAVYHSATPVRLFL